MPGFEEREIWKTAQLWEIVAALKAEIAALLLIETWCTTKEFRSRAGGVAACSRRKKLDPTSWAVKSGRYESPLNKGSGKCTLYGL